MLCGYRTPGGRYILFFTRFAPCFQAGQLVAGFSEIFKGLQAFSDSKLERFSDHRPTSAFPASVVPVLNYFTVHCVLQKSIEGVQYRLNHVLGLLSFSSL